MHAGISTLTSPGLLPSVARNGVFVVDLQTTLPFSQVLALHRSDPELFGGEDAVTVRLAQGDVEAFWC